MNKEKLFVVPNNDAEAVRIQQILTTTKNQFLVTQQGWGASWSGLEDEIKSSLRQFEGSIYGVELKDPENEFGGINIDHHSYGQDDDRTNDKSAIEQVAEIINYEMNIEDMFISENDKGFIPKMEQLGINLKISGYELEKMIQKIRLLDRQAQGITKEQENQAVEVINSLNITSKQNLVVVHLQHSKCSTITDRLYGLYDNLLILSDDGESNFYGVGNVVNQLHEKFEGWKGGNLPDYGFWGGYAPQNEIEKFIKDALIF